MYRDADGEPYQPAALVVRYAVNHEHRPATVNRYQLEAVPARSRHPCEQVTGRTRATAQHG